ncbi:hypothetical protein HCG51_13325 [Tolypothrix sp. PCC 7910]|uniref:heterocyst-inhibiting protein PatX n=1 Tax=Tolypothrix sp. PCC 7910 TaxID=2099387 RepID=UPI0014277DD2|nr:hypothetical protein [Tolypothrix sp. PCC 7910]QIR37595.1 hypothetical protein HCG51_13325 [Tolypothrix sp. PCC 7910]
MRAVVSLLASSLVAVSFAINCQATINQFSRLLPSSSGSEHLLSARPKPKPNQPEKPVPHRGSGRRELIESYKNVHPAV